MASAVASRPFRVCFVALNAYPAIDPQAPGAIGGIETRAWMFARALVARGDCEVQFVVRHTQPLRKTVVDGVTLVPILDRFYRLRESVSTRIERQPLFPYLRIRNWSLGLLWQLPFLAMIRQFRAKPPGPREPQPLLQAIDTDLFCTFGVQSFSAATIASAHAAGRPTVLVLGSDSDLDERYTEHSTWINPYTDRGDLCWWIVRNADVVVTQTAWQQQRLQSQFARTGACVENPIDVEEWDARQILPLADTYSTGWDRYILWVGRAEAVHKRPQVCLELARLCPQAQFLLVLNPRDDGLEEHLRQTAPANVRFVRHVPFPQMPALFRRAVALVNTSSLEGFPNTFLQAALSRIPVGALDVGDVFLPASGAGVACGGSLQTLADFTNRVWADPTSWQSRMETAREYVIQNHGLAAKATAFFRVLLAARSSSPTKSQT